MPGAPRLTLLFAALLTEVATAGCGADDDCLNEQIIASGAARLKPFLDDGKLTPAECQTLCPAQPPGSPEQASSTTTSTAGMTTDPTTGAAPGDGSTTAATTGSTTTDATSTTAVDGAAATRSGVVIGCSPIPGNTIHIRCQYGSTTCKDDR